MRIRQRFDHISSNSIQFFFFFCDLYATPIWTERGAKKKRSPATVQNIFVPAALSVLHSGVKHISVSQLFIFTRIWKEQQRTIVKYVWLSAHFWDGHSGALYFNNPSPPPLSGSRLSYSYRTPSSSSIIVTFNLGILFWTSLSLWYLSERGVKQTIRKNFWCHCDSSLDFCNSSRLCN